MADTPAPVQMDQATLNALIAAAAGQKTFVGKVAENGGGAIVGGYLGMTAGPVIGTAVSAILAPITGGASLALIPLITAGTTVAGAVVGHEYGKKVQ